MVRACDCAEKQGPVKPTTLKLKGQSSKIKPRSKGKAQRAKVTEIHWFLACVETCRMCAILAWHNLREVAGTGST